MLKNVLDIIFCARISCLRDLLILLTMSDIPLAIIVPFSSQYQKATADLVLHIQNVEAGLGISLDEQQDLADIERHYLLAGGGFWVALDSDDRVVGTIGLLKKTDDVAVLKKFFVKEDWRGGGRQCASRLYEALIGFARLHGIRVILLDTPATAVRSHAFYKRHGFERISADDLPVIYDYPDRDSLLFRLLLA